MIYIEKDALGLPLTKLITADMQVLERGETVEDKKTNIIITSKLDNFVHPCPGTNIYRCCNYHVADIMQGCPFDCSYCILQAYLPHKHIKVSACTDNVCEDILKAVASGKRRIGTGELADSLALDHLIPLSKILIPLANSNDNLQLELKTKSAQIGNLLNLPPKNTVIAWSLNPHDITATEEPLTAPLKRRLEAAKTVADYGYKVAFHFDPLIMTDNFEQVYGALFEELTGLIPEKSVEFISISTFRCPQELMDSIRARPKSSVLTKGDFIKGLDGKIRYFKAQRIKMIKFAFTCLRKEWKKVFIYLCMEQDAMWKQLHGFDPGEREEFEKLFPFYNRLI